MTDHTIHHDVDSDVEEWLDQLDPATVPSSTGRHTRAIIAARESVEDSERQLRDAVDEARAAGETWAAIGMALGTTRQNAYQRFGR